MLMQPENKECPLEIWVMVGETLRGIDVTT